MFVTVWLGILEISTGKLTAANAGHEYPAIRKANGTFEIYKDRHGFVVGGIDGIQYQEYELQMQPGDCIFQYTDGVTEATNRDEQLFGKERMLHALNHDPSADAEELLSNVLTEITAFAGDEPQFDDITMLCLKYCGIQAEDHPEEHVLQTDAKTDRLGEVLVFIEQHLEAAGCSPKAQSQISVAAEEIFVNIANYAYPEDAGRVQIRLWLEEESRQAVITNNP